MSEKFLQKEMNGIVGFEILVEEVQAAYKLSQNRNEPNHTNIIHELQKTEDPQALAIAKAMQNKGTRKKR